MFEQKRSKALKEKLGHQSPTSLLVPLTISPTTCQASKQNKIGKRLEKLESQVHVKQSSSEANASSERHISVIMAEAIQKLERNVAILCLIAFFVTFLFLWSSGGALFSILKRLALLEASLIVLLLGSKASFIEPIDPSNIVEVVWNFILCSYLAWLNLKILGHSYICVTRLLKKFTKATTSQRPTKHSNNEGTCEDITQNPYAAQPDSAPNEESLPDLRIHSTPQQRKPWAKDALFYESIRPRKKDDITREKCRQLAIRIAEKSAELVRLARDNYPISRENERLQFPATNRPKPKGTDELLTILADKVEKIDKSTKVEKLSEEGKLKEEVFNLPAGRLAMENPIAPSPPPQRYSGLQADHIANPTDNIDSVAGTIGEAQVPELTSFSPVLESPEEILNESFNSLEVKVVVNEESKNFVGKYEAIVLKASAGSPKHESNLKLNSPKQPDEIADVLLNSTDLGMKISKGSLSADGESADDEAKENNFEMCQDCLVESQAILTLTPCQTLPTIQEIPFSSRPKSPEGAANGVFDLIADEVLDSPKQPEMADGLLNFTDAGIKVSEKSLLAVNGESADEKVKENNSEFCQDVMDAPPIQEATDTKTPRPLLNETFQLPEFLGEKIMKRASLGESQAIVPLTPDQSLPTVEEILLLPRSKSPEGVVNGVFDSLTDEVVANESETHAKYEARDANTSVEGLKNESVLENSLKQPEMAVVSPQNFTDMEIKINEELSAGNIEKNVEEVKETSSELFQDLTDLPLIQEATDIKTPSALLNKLPQLVEFPEEEMGKKVSPGECYAIVALTPAQNLPCVEHWQSPEGGVEETVVENQVLEEGEHLAEECEAKNSENCVESPTTKSAWELNSSKQPESMNETLLHFTDNEIKISEESLLAGGIVEEIQETNSKLSEDLIDLPAIQEASYTKSQLFQDLTGLPLIQEATDIKTPSALPNKSPQPVEFPEEEMGKKVSTGERHAIVALTPAQNLPCVEQSVKFSTSLQSPEGGVEETVVENQVLEEGEHLAEECEAKNSENGAESPITKSAWELNSSKQPESMNETLLHFTDNEIKISEESLLAGGIVEEIQETNSKLSEDLMDIPVIQDASDPTKPTDSLTESFQSLELSAEDVVKSASAGKPQATLSFISNQILPLVEEITSISPTSKSPEGIVRELFHCVEDKVVDEELPVLTPIQEEVDPKTPKSTHSKTVQSENLSLKDEGKGASPGISGMLTPVQEVSQSSVNISTTEGKKGRRKGSKKVVSSGLESLPVTPLRENVMGSIIQVKTIKGMATPVRRSARKASKSSGEH